MQKIFERTEISLIKEVFSLLDVECINKSLTFISFLDNSRRSVTHTYTGSVLNRYFDVPRYFDKTNDFAEQRRLQKFLFLYPSPNYLTSDKKT